MFEDIGAAFALQLNIKLVHTTVGFIYVPNFQELRRISKHDPDAAIIKQGLWGA